jgi:hypothetical protein
LHSPGQKVANCPWKLKEEREERVCLATEVLEIVSPETKSQTLTVATNALLNIF